jgi:diguanylate cyclase (GGDEF)-like protein/PAS domain S-box-containing protein
MRYGLFFVRKAYIMLKNNLQNSIILSGVLCILIFIVELLTPRGVSESTLYVIVVLASLWSRNRRMVFAAIIVCTFLTILGLFLSPESSELWKSVVNRIFAIFAFSVIGVIGINLLKSEERLIESYRRYQNVLDQMLEGAQIIGFDWRYAYVNEEAAKQGQQSRENLIGRTMMETYPGIEHTRLFSVLSRCMEERTSYHMENKFTFPDGNAGWFELSIQPVHEGLFILSNDITKRKLAENKLYELNLELEKRIAERTIALNTANEHLQNELVLRRQAEKLILRQNKMLSHLHEITLDLLRYQDTEQLFTKIVELSEDFLGASYAEIMLAEEDELVVHATTQNQKYLIGKHMKREEAMLSWQVFETQKPVVLSDYSTWMHRKDKYDELALHAVAGFPILNNEQCMGVLALGCDQPDYEFNQDQIQFGSLFASLAALIIINTQLRETLKQQSIRDPLTGLFNRRYMEETLKREISRVTRHLRPLGVIMIDIDHFKRYNDTFGHATGDSLLRDVGRFLQGRVRGEDIACRYGGEEFILILPDASLEIVQNRAEQLRGEVNGLTIHPHHGITLSLGVAVYPQHGRTIDAVLRAADAALYRAKQKGRNRVVVAEEN